MSDKVTLINQILKTEWNMFTNAKTLTGNKSLCQEDPNTFKIMRVSQFASYSEAVLESYFTDLNNAIKNKRNLIAEKYAWMMKTSMPIEFSRIQHLLPQQSPDNLYLIYKIVEIELAWHEKILVEYPYLVGRGRPLYSTEDNQLVTSVETYLKGELLTYSIKTLELYYKHRLNQNADNINGIKMIMLHTIKQYGYKSLEEANEKIKEKYL